MTFTPSAPQIQTVSELTSSLKGLLETHYSFVSVSGEISSLRVPYSGHHYFLLKDDTAQIRAVLFKGQSRYLSEKLADGQQVLCRGRITIYEPRGDYQIIVDQITPLGTGNLQLAFEQRKQALAARGFFDQQHKQGLPHPIQRLCLITSPTGAAVHDFLSVALARFPHLQVEILPVRVQGDEAAGEICQAIHTANKRRRAEVVIITRGGGSLEDLWAFNDEKLVETIFHSRLPVVSAVGHEIDFTLCDFVADLRAATPTAAAEMVVSDFHKLSADITARRHRLLQAQQALLERLAHQLSKLRHGLGDPRAMLDSFRLRLDHDLALHCRAMTDHINQARQQLTSLRQQLRQFAPLTTIARQDDHLRRLRQRLGQAMTDLLARERMALATTAARLDGLSPLAVLGRGYSLTYTADKTLITSVNQVKEGQKTGQQLQDGFLHCQVEKVIPNKQK